MLFIYRNFNEVLRDHSHVEFFKRFLKAHRSEVPFLFVLSVESLRNAHLGKDRHSKARAIVKKYFHNHKYPANELLLCDTDLIRLVKWICFWCIQTVVISILQDLNKALFSKENSSEQTPRSSQMTESNTKLKDANQEMHTKQSTRTTLRFRELNITFFTRTNDNMRWMHVARAAEPEPEIGTPELGILAGAGAQTKNQEPEFSLKFRNGAGAMAIWKVAPAPGSFLDTNGFAK